MDTNGKCNESNPAPKPTPNGGFILMILNFKHEYIHNITIKLLNY